MSEFVLGLVKSKTFWVNAVVLMSAIVAGDDIKQFIDPDVLVKVQAMVNILLRILTTQSLPEKGRA